MRKIFFNQDYFEVIDTEEKAYWLGLIFADGNVNKTTPDASRANRLTLNASGDDISQLEKFAKAIGYTGQIRSQIQPESYSETPSYRIQCNSIKMCDDLARLRCTPRKTGKSSLPKLSPELIPHFIRGYFDGDGSISVYYQKDKRKPTYANRLKQEFAITSDRHILEQIQEILIVECELPKTKLKEYKRTDKAVSLRYGGRQQIIKIYHYLYDNASVYLKRKHDKFSLLLSQETRLSLHPSA